MKSDVKRFVAHLATCLICCPHFTTFQVGSGTVVAYTFTRYKFALAADSRETFDNHPPTDDRCKIATFGNQFVFASTGSAEVVAAPTAQISSWSNIAEARHAIEQATSMTPVSTIADSWAQSLKAKWAVVYATDPDLVKTAAGLGIITEGIFAEAKDGLITVAVRDIRLNTNSIDAVPFNCPINDTCVMGATDSIWQIDAAQPMKASPALLKAYDPALLRVLRLVDLWIAYAPPIKTPLGEVSPVGPPIDAVEMDGNGTMQWLHKELNCNEPHDYAPRPAGATH